MSDTGSETETVVQEWKPERQILTASEDKGFKSGGSIELRIDRFVEFVGDGQKRWSAPMNIRGFPFEICANSSEKDELNNHNGQAPSKALEVYLYCNRGWASKTWNCQAKIALRVMAQKEGINDLIRQDTKDLNEGQSNLAFSEIETCDMLLDPKNGYIKNDRVILQANVQPSSVKIMTGIHAIDNGSLFSSTTTYLWDFVLIIQSEEVHVQKIYLAMHSEYFKDQFAKHERVNRAILNNIGYHDFIELLNVIYPSLCSITAENVETITELAFKFDMAALLRKCEVFLVDNISKFVKVKPLLLAEWYGLVDLQKKIVDQIRNIADIKAMKPEYDMLSYQTKRLLFDKTCSPVPVSNPVLEPENIVITADRAMEILQKLASDGCLDPDGILIVENNRIPIHKDYLAVYSKFFKQMFHGDFVERNMDQIALEEVVYGEVLELLAVIYPAASPITDVNVGVILKMADRYLMPAILERCEKHLRDSTEIRAARKLWLAQRYNLPNLQAECAKNYKTTLDIGVLKAEPEFGLFDDKTRALLLDSITS